MKLCKKFIGRATRVCALAAVAAVLGAWDDDCGCDRYEFVTRGVGDAVQVNKVTQMITPWPHYVKNRKLNLDGHRASIAMRRYQANQVIQPNLLAAQMAHEQTNNNSSNALPEPGNGDNREK